MKLAALLLALAGLPSIAQAQTSAMTLSAALALANTNNLEVIAAARSVDLAKAALTQVAQSPLQAQVTPGITRDAPLGLGTLQTITAGVTQQFSPTVGAQREAAASGVQIALGQFAASRRDVDQRVVAAYFSLASAQAIVVTAQQSVATAQRLEKGAKLRARVGAAGSFEVLRARVELRRVQTDLLRAQANAHTAVIGLNLLLGRAGETPTVVILAPAPTTVSDTDALYAAAQRIDPQLAQFRAGISQAIAQARAARLERAPTVGISAGYLFQRAPSGGQTSRGPTASVTLGLPVLDYGTIRGAVRQAQAREAVAEAQVRGRDAQLRADLERDVVDIESARARLSFSRDSLTQAQDALRLAQFGYQRGALGVLDVLSARNQLAAAQSEATQAAADLGAAVARLQLVVGVPVSP